MTKNQTTLAHIKTADFCPNNALFLAAIFAYNTLHLMALCSSNKILQRWEPATMRTFLIRQENGRAALINKKLRVPERMLYNAQWQAWVAVTER